MQQHLSLVYLTTYLANCVRVCAFFCKKKSKIAISFFFANLCLFFKRGKQTNSYRGVSSPCKRKAQRKEAVFYFPKFYFRCSIRSVGFLPRIASLPKKKCFLTWCAIAVVAIAGWSDLIQPIFFWTGCLPKRKNKCNTIDCDSETAYLRIGMARATAVMVYLYIKSDI